MSVFELATIVPGTLPPFLRMTTARGPVFGSGAVEAAPPGLGFSAAVAAGASVVSFFAHDERNIMPKIGRTAIVRVIELSSL
jgi:hypothetical protein